MNLDLILETVQAKFRVGRKDLLAPSRSLRHIAWARQVAMYLAHTLPPGRSYTEVGRLFGRDRTTVRHACQVVEDLRGEGDDLDTELTEIERVCATPPV